MEYFDLFQLDICSDTVQETHLPLEGNNIKIDSRQEIKYVN